MNVHEDALERVAGAITDGLPVGWESEKAARPELSESLDVLRQLDAMARTLGDTTDDTLELPAEAPALRSWGHLRIVEKIGQGGFGEVYRAHDPALNLDVAVKLYRGSDSPDGLTEDQFLDEAQRLARVRHPNVLVVHGAARHAGTAGMWTELLEGQTLEALVSRQGPLSPREAAAIGIELCGALAAIHHAGLIHRDVKTENVLRERGGRLVLLDLGCGVEIPAGGQDHLSTSIRGTPLAMAPEQLQGRTSGPATDIYGLGVLLYRLVTGRYPIEASSFYELVQKHNARESVGLRDLRPDLPAEFIRVIEKATDMDSSRRFRTAGEMERALAECTEVAIEDRPAPAPGPAPVPALRWALDLMFGRPLGRFATAVVAGIIIAGIWLGTRPKPHAGDVVGMDRAQTASRTDDPGAAGFTVKANLFRERPEGDQRLATGSRIEPGDLLFLEIEATRDFHTYVLAEDQKGKAFVLFPTPAFDAKNPLPGGRLHRLPGTRGGEQSSWVVTSAGGDESVVVIGSLKPLEALERDIANIPSAAPGAPVEYGEVSEATKQQIYRGIGGVSESPSARGGAEPRVLRSVMRLLPGESKRTDSLWVWQIQLSNP